MAEWQVSDESEPTLEALAAKVAQTLVDETPLVGITHIRAVPIEVMAGMELALEVGKVHILQDGQVHERSINKRICWEAMVRAGYLYLDSELPNRNRVKEISSMTDFFAYDVSGVWRYRWDSNPVFCRKLHREVFMHLPQSLLAQIERRSNTSQVHKSSLLTAYLVAGMGVSEEWLPTLAPLARQAITSWVECMRIGTSALSHVGTMAL